MQQNHKTKITDEQIINIYDKKLTLHESAVELNMTVVSLWRRAKKLDIKWSDYKRKKSPKLRLSDILNGLHPEFQTYKLKLRLISENIKENKCEICNITTWNNKNINMHLDHIDGDSHNHRLINLRMICPNCHSQTETYCGKNI